MFYKSDTIKFIKFSNRITGVGSLKFAEDDADYLQTNDIIHIDLLSKHKMELEELNVENWQVTTKKGKWAWRYDKSTRTIKMYYNEKLLFQLKPFVAKEVIVRSKLAEDEIYLTTVELTLIKRNP